MSKNALDDLRVRVEGGCVPTVGEATDTGATRPSGAALPLAAADDRDQRQQQVFDWAVRCFGEEHCRSLPQRGIRLVEEAIEAAQACGCDPAMVHKLVDYIYAKPPGQIGQELGGVATTLLALANAAGLSAEMEERMEVTRVLGKTPEYFAARNRTKNEAGFDVTGGYPTNTPTPDVASSPQTADDASGMHANTKEKL